MFLLRIPRAEGAWWKICPSKKDRFPSIYPSRKAIRWLDLVVFPASEAIPLATVRSFWGLGLAESRQLCRRLSDLCLLDFDGWAATVRLHPLVSCFLARRRHADLPALRARLLEIQRNGS